MKQEIIRRSDPRWSRIAAEARGRKVRRASRKPVEREDKGNPGPWKFAVLGTPIGKPRQSQRDKWKKRPCVIRAREWADAIRAAMPEDLPPRCSSLHVIAYMPIPKSYPKRRTEAIKGDAFCRPHNLKPDADNLLKLIMDALFANDQCVANVSCQKFFEDGRGPRVEITVER